METILAFGPFVVLLTLILILRWPLWLSCLVTLATTVLVTGLGWGVSANVIGASIISTIIPTLEIGIIVYCAMLIWQVLAAHGATNQLGRILTKLCADRRWQALFLAWTSCTLLEGITGFGIPAAIIAPMLIGIGFRPLTSIVISLLGNSTAVTFGALGTPIVVGVGQSIPTQLLSSAGTSLNQIALLTSGLHLSAVLLVPVAIVWLVIAKTPNRTSNLLQTLPLIGSLTTVYMAAYILTASSAYYQLTSVVTGIVGCCWLIICAKQKWFMLKELYNFAYQTPSTDLEREHPFKSLLPIFVIVSLLLVTKLATAGLNIDLIRFESILGTNYSSALQLSSAATPMIVSTIVYFAIWGRSTSQLAQITKNSLIKVVKPILVIASLVCFSQILINSGENQFNLPAIPDYLAQMLMFSSNLYPLLSSVLGVFTSFITGTSTGANLLLSGTQWQVATSIGINPAIVLAAQLVGTALGNSFSLLNINVIQAVVQQKDLEAKVIQINAPLALLYSLLAGVIATLAVVLH